VSHGAGVVDNKECTCVVTGPQADRPGEIPESSAEKVFKFKLALGEAPDGSECAAPESQLEWQAPDG